MAEAGPMPMCPMAETCKGMMGKPISGLVLIIPGIAFMAVGVLILIWPAILVWLIAAASILTGIVMLMMVNFMRKVSARFKSLPDQP